MELEIGNYKITNDKHNWILQEKKVSNPNHPMSKSTESKEYFVDIGYFGKIEHLMNSLLNKELKESEVNTLEDIKQAIYQAENNLKNDINKLIGVKVNES